MFYEPNKREGGKEMPTFNIQHFLKRSLIDRYQISLARRKTDFMSTRKAINFH